MSHQSDLISQDIVAYLAQHERKELLRFLTCGNVDDGKSTLIGRLLHDSKMIYEDHLEAITKDSKKVGTTGDDVDLHTLPLYHCAQLDCFLGPDIMLGVTSIILPAPEPGAVLAAIAALGARRQTTAQS